MRVKILFTDKKLHLYTLRGKLKPFCFKALVHFSCTYFSPSLIHHGTNGSYGNTTMLFALKPHFQQADKVKTTG